MYQDDDAPRERRVLPLYPIIAIVAIVALAIYFLVGSPGAPFRLKPASGTAAAMSLASDNDAPIVNQMR